MPPAYVGDLHHVMRQEERTTLTGSGDLTRTERKRGIFTYVPDITCSFCDDFETDINGNECYENACRDVEELQIEAVQPTHTINNRGQHSLGMTILRRTELHVHAFLRDNNRYIE
jgi:hypothetical protein